MVRSVGAMKKEAYAAAPTSDRTAAPTSPRFHMTVHSSKRYSPKSHSAVKKTTSNATRNPTPFHCRYGERSSNPDVTSVLAIRMGVNSGSSSKGKSSSRIRACAEIADNAVPAVDTPRLPRKNTRASQCSTGSTRTLYMMANIGRSSSSVSSRKSVFAASFARKITNGSDTDSRNALNVSLVCSRRKQGCSISDAAKRNASHSSPAPNRRASSDSGSKVKLNNTSTIRMKTMVVVSNSRERNSVRSSLPSKTVVFAKRVIDVNRLRVSKRKNRANVRARSRIGHNCPGIQPNRACRQRRNLRFAVQAHHDGAPCVTHPPQRFRQPRSALRIQSGRGLVQQQNARRI